MYTSHHTSSCENNTIPEYPATLSENPVNLLDIQFISIANPIKMGNYTLSLQLIQQVNPEAINCIVVFGL
jgi:hypothetical protein